MSECIHSVSHCGRKSNTADQRPCEAVCSVTKHVQLLVNHYTAVNSDSLPLSRLTYAHLASVSPAALHT